MNFSLSKKFTLLSLIAFLITGLLISYSVSNHMKQDKLNSLLEITLLTLDTRLKPELTLNDFQPPLTESKKALLNETLNRIMNSSDISGLRIWNKESKEIFSSSISTRFESGQDISQTLNDKVQMRIINLDKELYPEVKSNEFVHIVSPITLNQKVEGVYEVLIPYTDIRKHIISLNITITGITFFGLLILYFFLMRIIYNASQTLVIQNESLLEQKLSLEHSYTQLDYSYKNTVIALSKAVDARDKYTSGHSQRVAKISTSIGQIMGLDPKRLQLLELAAFFHDVGKIGIPDEILHKPNKLTDSEFEMIKLHPSIGVSILKDISFLKSTLPIILHHHERYNGSGYPAGIKGEAIPLESRIIAVADTFDAMTSDRPYRKSLLHNIAMKEIQKCAGTQFDENIVAAFLKIDFLSLEKNIINSPTLQDLA